MKIYLINKTKIKHKWTLADSFFISGSIYDPLQLLIFMSSLSCGTSALVVDPLLDSVFLVQIITLPYLCTSDTSALEADSFLSRLQFMGRTSDIHVLPILQKCTSVRQHFCLFISSASIYELNFSYSCPSYLCTSPVTRNRHS